MRRIMKNIGIIIDSTAILSEKLKNHPNVHSVSLAVVVNGEHYLDGKDIKEKEWTDYLKQDANMTTSQPSIADTMDVLKLAQSKNYDHIFVLPITKHLSGTHDGFLMANQEIKLKNATFYDTVSIAGPIGYMVEVLLDLAAQDANYETMIQALDTIRDHNQTLIYPGTLKRLIKSGRMNKTVGNLASVLKLKPVLILENKGEKIEKLDVVRTEKKVMSLLIENMIQFGADSDWVFYILEVNHTDFYDKMKVQLTETFGQQVEIRDNFLPGVIATHVGLDVFGIQCVKKVR